MTKRDREIVAGELVKVARDLTAAKGPFLEGIDKYWNELHDLERNLEQASYEYDVAASYRGKEGMRDAEAMKAHIKQARQHLQKLTDSFSTITNHELKFIKKHGTPEQYVERKREEMFPR
jgi:hypothetical protein